jgi:hypothetical protein
MTRTALACYLAAAVLLLKRFVFSGAGLRPEDWDANIRANERALRRVNQQIHRLNRAQRDDHRHWREPQLQRLHAKRARLERENAALTCERAACAADLGEPA